MSIRADNFRYMIYGIHMILLCVHALADIQSLYFFLCFTNCLFLDYWLVTLLLTFCSKHNYLRFVSGVSTSPVKEVYIAVNDTLELNCSINATIHNIHPTQLGWKHHGLILINFTCILNNNTIQLRKNHTQYDDAGVYECGLFNSAKFQSVQKIVVVVGGMLL